MRSREISVGRAAKDHIVDVDLTLEVALDNLIGSYWPNSCSLLQQFLLFYKRARQTKILTTKGNVYLIRIFGVLVFPRFTSQS